MNKVLISILTLVMLSGCSSYYDYYKSGVRYTQDGENCIFYSVERGRYFSDEISSIDTDKKIVYQNTKCDALYNRNAFSAKHHHHTATVTPPVKKSCDCKKSCGCKKSCKYVKVK